MDFVQLSTFREIKNNNEKIKYNNQQVNERQIWQKNTHSNSFLVKKSIFLAKKFVSFVKGDIFASEKINV